MDSILLKIRSMYNQMGRGEKKIADWILEHSGEIISLSINELASACQCGDATVVRFSKRLGLGGYQALKIRIAQEAGSDPITSLSFSKSDSCADIFQKHVMDLSMTFEKTKNVLNYKVLEASAKAIMQARSISIFGLGNSAPVTMDAAHKFMRAGLVASACNDNHMQMITASHLTEKDVVIGISHSGSSVDVVKAMELARKNHAKTICITNHGRSPIVKCSDYALFTNAEETKYTILGMSSRIAQLAIIDTLYIYISLYGDNSIATAIQQTEEALESKKY